MRVHKWAGILIVMCGIAALASLSFAVMAQSDETAANSPDPSVSMPVFNHLPLNESALQHQNFQQVNGAVSIYNAPNGSVLRTRPEGQFFVSVISEVDGWTQINPGEWIPSAQLTPAPLSYLRGVLLNNEAEMSASVGILHHSVYARSQPGEAYDEGHILWEYMPVEVRDTAEVGGIEYVNIEKNLWVTGEYVRHIHPVERPDGIASARWVGVDLTQQVLIAYDGDTPVFATLVSTGLEDSPTEAGIHDTYLRFAERAMSRSHPSQPAFYLMEDVPYTFYFNGDQALHGAYWHNHFGTQQSHGCVNMSLTDAAWLYNWFSETLDVTDAEAIWPQVYVYESAAVN